HLAEVGPELDRLVPGRQASEQLDGHLTAPQPPVALRQEDADDALARPALVHARLPPPEGGPGVVLEQAENTAAPARSSPACGPPGRPCGGPGGDAGGARPTSSGRGSG